MSPKVCIAVRRRPHKTILVSSNPVIFCRLVCMVAHRPTSAGRALVYATNYYRIYTRYRDSLNSATISQSILQRLPSLSSNTKYLKSILSPPARFNAVPIQTFGTPSTLHIALQFNKLAMPSDSSDTESQHSDMDYDYDANYDGEDQDLPSNGLTLQGPPWGLEKIHDYEPGGHHPVRLADVLHQRYKVIHKLGSGGFANVWFCHDISPQASPENKYVALKIIMDEGSTDECPELRVSELANLAPESTISTGLWCLPLDRFDIEGPNGKHFAFVYPVLGPRVSKLLPLAQDPNTDLGEVLRKLCQQTTQAMALLHAIGICHGGL